MYQVKDRWREWPGRFVGQAHAESRGEGGGRACELEEAGNSLPRNFSYRVVGPPPGKHYVKAGQWSSMKDDRIQYSGHGSMCVSADGSRRMRVRLCLCDNVHQRVWNDLSRTRLSHFRMIWLHFHPLPPSPVSKLSLFLSSYVSPVQFTDRRWGRGMERSKIIRWRESLVLYKIFNTL